MTEIHVVVMPVRPQCIPHNHLGFFISQCQNNVVILYKVASITYFL